MLPSESRSRSQWVTIWRSMNVSFKTLDNFMRSYLTWSSYLALSTILSLRQTIGAIAIVLICPPCTDHNCSKDGRISVGLFWLLSSVVSQKFSGTFKCARNDLFKCYQTIGTPRHIGRSKDFHKVRYFYWIWTNWSSEDWNDVVMDESIYSMSLLSI